MLAYHRKSFIRAIVNLYPNIGLDRTKFSILPCMSNSSFSLPTLCSPSLSALVKCSLLICWLYSAGYWSDARNRRHFFDTLAHKHNFDPLLRNNWYQMSKDSFQDNKV